MCTSTPNSAELIWTELPVRDVCSERPKWAAGSYGQLTSAINTLRVSRWLTTDHICYSLLHFYPHHAIAWAGNASVCCLSVCLV